MPSTPHANVIAITAGRKYVRPETGFFHYTYHALPNVPHVTIPVYENLNWALANFQLKSQEGVLEGKRLLERLLPYQNSEGEFPVYLHEYPVVHDNFLGAYLFQPLFYILRDFGNVIGSDLKNRLKDCLKQLIDALKKRYEERSPQGHIKFKVGTALWAINQDDTLLKDCLGHLVSSTQIADLEFAKDLDTPHMPAWPDLYWHRGMQVYCGPAYNERQEGASPEITLLDLMMGSERKKELTPHHVNAALIQSCPVPVKENVRGIKQGSKWAYAALEQEGELPLYHQQGFHLFRFLIQGEKEIDSMAIQGGKFQKVTFVEEENKIIFDFHLPLEFETEHREKSRELELFISLGAHFDYSTFKLNETVTVTFQHAKVKLTFRQISGTGDFVGHRSQGDRPAQLAKGGIFDWILSLRTLRRSTDAVIQLEIEIEENVL